jgi:hypothetical protein
MRLSEVWTILEVGRGKGGDRRRHRSSASLWPNLSPHPTTMPTITVDAVCLSRRRCTRPFPKSLLCYRFCSTWTGTSDLRTYLLCILTREGWNIRTLIDSTPGVMQAWHIFGKDYGFDAEAVAQMTHGRRLYDTLKEYCHIDDEAKLHVSYHILGFSTLCLT